MKMHFLIIRDEITSTSVTLDLMPINLIHRTILSTLRNSGKEASKYHYVGYSSNLDISCTDRLEELTATVTGSSFNIVNKRVFDKNCLEFDLEKIDA